MSLQLPSTRGRLQKSITIRVIPDPEIFDKLGAGNTFLYGTYASMLTANSQLLGQVRSLKRNQSREVYRRHSLGKNAFQAFQVVPLKMTTSLTLERTVLYKMDILKRVFEFWGESLAFQQIPFTIVEEKHSATGSLDEMAVIFYNQCWFTTNPVEYDIHEDNNMVIQNKEVACGGMTVFDTSISGVMSALGETLTIASELTGLSSIGSNINIT